jgi:hypothetical protein
MHNNCLHQAAERNSLYQVLRNYGFASVIPLGGYDDQGSHKRNH